MQQHLFDHVDVRPYNTFLFNGTASDPELGCLAFEAKTRAVGEVDVWLLGIGGNGHIAFNEPGSGPESRSRVVALHPETVEANSRHFADPSHVLQRALTVGLATILEGRSIALLATGVHKAAAVARAMEGPCTPDCPASLLQNHPDCTFPLDQAAASHLTAQATCERS